MRHIAIAATLLLSFSLGHTSSLAQESEDMPRRWELLEFDTNLKASNPNVIPLQDPPVDTFKRVEYASVGVGYLGAYITPDPKDGAKHPAIIWITGGLSNAIGDVWSDQPRTNDQSATAYAKAGVVTMFPSLRGGNSNSGQVEWMFGEVKDIMAAREHLASLPYVDPDRIFLGGHSTGGTLVYLTAESTDKFRGVFSFGPTALGTVFDASMTLIDFSETSSEMLKLDPLLRENEIYLRAPIVWNQDVRTPLYVFEGAKGGNIDHLDLLQENSENPLIHFHKIEGADHFSVLAPVNEMIAQKILEDDGSGEFSLSRDEILAVKP